MKDDSIIGHYRLVNDKEIERFFMKIAEMKTRGLKPAAIRQLALGLTNNFSVYDLEKLVDEMADLVKLNNIHPDLPITLPAEPVEECCEIEINKQND